ncbi:MAG: phage terminase large subunit [Clostridia bacterium]
MMKGSAGSGKSVDTAQNYILRLMQDKGRNLVCVRKADMGFDEYTFHANSNCCGICQDLNGKHFKIKDMMPGENAAPLHPGCRCSCSAYEDSDEYEAWLDFLANGGTTEEWKQKNAGKSVTNKSGYGIIEMTRKINDNRDGFKFISDKIFNDPCPKEGCCYRKRNG